MISIATVREWAKVAQWQDFRQVELDLIIARALVCIFSDEFLRQELRFRGGTALNKIHFPAPYRFSEDIDLVRTNQGSIGTLLSRLRSCLEPWLGKPKVVRKYFLAKHIYRIPVGNDQEAHLRLKIEINTRETQIYDQPTSKHFRVDSTWFSGEADISTYSREEILASKLRALLNRDKGRDLFDLGHALNVFEDLDLPLLVELFGKYSLAAGQPLTKVQAQERMIWKYQKTVLTEDISSLLPSKESENLTIPAAREVFWQVFDRIIDLIPGKDWAGTSAFVAKNR